MYGSIPGFSYFPSRICLWTYLVQGDESKYETEPDDPEKADCLSVFGETSDYSDPSNAGRDALVTQTASQRLHTHALVAGMGSKHCSQTSAIT